MALFTHTAELVFCGVALLLVGAGEGAAVVALTPAVSTAASVLSRFLGMPTPDRNGS